MPVTQQEQRALLLEELAVEGGKLFGEDDIVFEGDRFVLPSFCAGLDEAIEFYTERRNDEEKAVSFTRTFPYRPLDGARATAKAITKGAGFTLTKTIRSFWGSQLPELREIATGPNPGDREQVPWGALSIPGMDGSVVQLGQTQDPDLGTVFHIDIRAPRKYRFAIKGLFARIDHYLRTDSLYRGKAIDGQDNFIDVHTIDPADIIYSERVERRLQCEVWDRIRYVDTFARLKQGLKRAFLLEGPNGSGKTAAADITAQVAIEHGWTFLICRPGRDDVRTVMQMARMYQPAVVFREDLDTVAEAGADDINMTLDVMDGIDTKGLRLMVIMTTNDVESIHKGMSRPGRLHGIIHIGAMDDSGIERLTRRVIGDGLASDIEWPRVVQSMDGYMPAFVREALDRVVGYSVSANKGELGLITTDDIVDAADSLREQFDLHNRARTAGMAQPIEHALRTVVADEVATVLSNTQVCDQDDGYHRFDLVPSVNGD